MPGMMRKLAEAGRLKKGRKGKWTVCLGHSFGIAHRSARINLEHEGVTSLHCI